MRSLRCCVKHGKMMLTVSKDLDGSGRGLPQASEAQEAKRTISQNTKSIALPLY